MRFSQNKKKTLQIPAWTVFAGEKKYLPNMHCQILSDNQLTYHYPSWLDVHIVATWDVNDDVQIICELCSIWVWSL